MTDIAHGATQNTYLPTQFQQYIHLSRYARWLDKENRRETWPETVNRYVNFFSEKFPESFPKDDVLNSILNLKVMPSMRALMTAGPALDRDNAASFNCSYLAIDHPRAFDEALYILMCFHPNTLVVTKRGNLAIKEVVAGDEVRSFDETTKTFKWCLVTQQIRTPSANRPKVEIQLENGETIKCTADHKWLTSNRSWVEAQDLTVEDDLVAPNFSIYKITNKESGKLYVGLTSKSVEARFKEHCFTAFNQNAEYALPRALRKYGQEAFSIEAIDVAYSWEEAVGKEKFWIKELNTYGEAGYNSTCGGEGTYGLKWSEESKQNASESAYERTEEHKAFQRKVLEASFEKINETRQTPEYKQAQRERNLGVNNPRYGKQHSEEWKQKLSLQNSGVNNPFYGRKHTEESKQKISLAKQKQEKEGVVA